MSGGPREKRESARRISFEQALAECLAQVEAGHLTPAQAADRFPQYPDLADLLQLADQIRALPLPEPSAAPFEEALARSLDGVEQGNGHAAEATADSSDYAQLRPLLGLAREIRRVPLPEQPPSQFDQMLAEALDDVEMGRMTPAEAAARFPRQERALPLLALAQEIRTLPLPAAVAQRRSRVLAGGVARGAALSPGILATGTSGPAADGSFPGSQPGDMLGLSAFASGVGDRMAGLGDKVRVLAAHHSTVAGFSEIGLRAATLLMPVVVTWSVLAPGAVASMPGEPLYPLKRLTEEVQYAATFGDAARAQLRLARVEARLQEAASAPADGKIRDGLLAEASAEVRQAFQLVSYLPDAEGSRLQTLAGQLALGAPLMEAPTQEAPVAAPSPPAATDDHESSDGEADVPGAAMGSSSLAQTDEVTTPLLVEQSSEDEPALPLEALREDIAGSAGGEPELPSDAADGDVDAESDSKPPTGPPPHASASPAPPGQAKSSPQPAAKAGPQPVAKPATPAPAVSGPPPAPRPKPQAPAKPPAPSKTSAPPAQAPLPPPGPPSQPPGQDVSAATPPRSLTQNWRQLWTPPAATAVPEAAGANGPEGAHPGGPADQQPTETDKPGSQTAPGRQTAPGLQASGAPGGPPGDGDTDDPSRGEEQSESGPPSHAQAGAKVTDEEIEGAAAAPEPTSEPDRGRRPDVPPGLADKEDTPAGATGPGQGVAKPGGGGQGVPKAVPKPGGQ